MENNKMYKKCLLLTFIVIASLTSACVKPTSTPPPEDTATPIPSPTPTANWEPGLTIITETPAPLHTPLSPLPVLDSPGSSIQDSRVISTTGILFLVDVSQSVVNLCGTNRQAGPQIVEFITTFLSNYYTDPDQETFQIGIDTFPVSENEIYDFSLNPLRYYRNSEDWYVSLKDQIAQIEDVSGNGRRQGINRLEYIGAIEQAANTLREGDFDKSIVVLLTDGMVNYKLNAREEENEWARLLSTPPDNNTQSGDEAFPLLSEIIKDDITLHAIILPCPVKSTDLDSNFPLEDYTENINNWNSLSGQKITTLFPSPLDYKLDDLYLPNRAFVPNAVYHFLDSYDLIAQSDDFPGLKIITPADVEKIEDDGLEFPGWSLSGNTGDMNVNIISWGLTHVEIYKNGSDNPDDFTWNGLLGQFHYENTVPSFSCRSIDWQIKANQEPSQDSFFALYWGNHSPFPSPFSLEIWYQSHQVSDGTPLPSIENATNFSIETRVNGGLTTFSECYEIWVELIDENLKEVYYSAHKPVASTMDWQIEYDPAVWQSIAPTMTLRVSLVNSEKILLSPPLTVPVKFSFSPELVEDGVIPSDENTSSRATFLEIPFRYATSDYHPDDESPQPEVYFVSSLTKADQEDEEDCKNKFPTGFVRDEKEMYIENGTEAYYVYPLEIENPSSDMEHGSYLRIALTMDPKWIDLCKYEYIAIQWAVPFSNTKVGRVWCDLNDKDSTCSTGTTWRIIAQDRP